MADRYLLVDVIRGGALVLMIGYHFTFDLNHFSGLGIDFNHSVGWLAFRTIIVSLFVCLVGISLYLAGRHGLNWVRYFRRLGLVALCAGLVTLASAVVFPRSYIYFGILHFIAVASVLGLLTLRLYRLNLLLGCAMIALGVLFSHPWFDQPAWQWIGLMTYKPFTEDYVPLLPWFGVVLIGQFIGRLVYQEPATGLACWTSSRPLWRILGIAGRYSLFVYMVHQPLLFGLLYLVFNLQIS